MAALSPVPQRSNILDQFLMVTALVDQISMHLKAAGKNTPHLEIGLQLLYNFSRKSGIEKFQYATEWEEVEKQAVITTIKACAECLAFGNIQWVLRIALWERFDHIQSCLFNDGADSQRPDPDTKQEYERFMKMLGEAEKTPG